MLSQSGRSVLGSPEVYCSECYCGDLEGSSALQHWNDQGPYNEALLIVDLRDKLHAADEGGALEITYSKRCFHYFMLLHTDCLVLPWLAGHLHHSEKKYFLNFQ